jgi:hypothetical protein
MSEQSPAVSDEEFRAIFPPQTTEKLIALESDIAADYEARAKHAGLLAYLRQDPTADPLHIRYHEQEIALIDAKLEQPHGQA